MAAHLVQMFDSTVVRAHVSAAGAKGGSMIRRLAARVAVFSTKIHLKTDFGGLPIALHLTGGEASDSRNFETLLDIGPDLNPRAALGDKGYDSKSNRDAARQRGICPAIPYRSNTKNMPAFFPKTTLQGTGTHRTSGRQAQTLQAYRTSMREDGAELRLVRRACSRLHLDQTRPHGFKSLTNKATVLRHFVVKFQRKWSVKSTT
jgi:transposase